MGASSTLTSRSTVGDIVKYEDNVAYTREAGTFRNASGGTITDLFLLGTPVKKASGKWVPVLAGDEANVEGIVLTDEKISSLADSTDYGKVTVLVRGPALINVVPLPADDVAGDALDKDDIAIALLSLSPPIVKVTEPAVVSEQTT